MTRQNQSALSTYQTQDIETASPEKLLIMLYDGAIRFLKKAREAMVAKDYQSLNTNMKRTQDIISELMGSLNFEIGGDIARNLFDLYEYYNYRLLQANMKNDTAMIDEVLKHLVDLKATWEEAIIIAKREASDKNPSTQPQIQTVYSTQQQSSAHNASNQDVPDESTYVGTTIDA